MIEMIAEYASFLRILGWSMVGIHSALVIGRLFFFLFDHLSRLMIFPQKELDVERDPIFHKKLQDHVGGLIRIKGQIFWFKYVQGVRRYENADDVEDRVVVLLEVDSDVKAWPSYKDCGRTVDDYIMHDGASRELVHIMVDGSPKWVWVVKCENLEFLDGAS
jgi:hypothetical protein